MSKPRETLSGWALADLPDQQATMRSPQERNLLQFSPFAAGFEEGPPSTKGRFRRVTTTVSGSNGPRDLTNLTSRQLSQMSSTDSGENATGASSLTDGKSATTSDRGQESPDEHGTNGVVETPWKEDSAPNSSENAGFSNSSTISLDQATLRSKLSALRPRRKREVPESEVVLDTELSQISGHRKPDTSEHGSTRIAGAKVVTDASGNPTLRRVPADLTRLKSEEGSMIRKLSGLLSRSKPGTPTGLQPEGKLDSDGGTIPRNVKAEKELPSRKGSLLGRFGRKDIQPQRKRSLILSPKRMKGRNKSCDAEVESEKRRVGEGRVGDKESEDPFCEKDVTVTSGITAFRRDKAGDSDVSITEDDLARRAVQIEKFLNSAAFL